ncbi:MAG: hydantoinase/oxoprolinase family protein, partial [Halohasta sp.]
PTVEYAADLRYSGQSFELTVPLERPFDAAVVGAAFHEAHESAAGYRMDDAVDLVTLRSTAVVERDPPAITHDPSGPAHTGDRPAVFDGDSVETAVYSRSGLSVDQSVVGPAIIEADESTTVLRPDWTATVAPDGTLRLRREATE